MNPATMDETLHECSQRERLERFDRVLFGNGLDGLLTKLARMEVRLTWVLRLNWFLATTWLLTIVAAIGRIVVAGFRP